LISGKGLGKCQWELYYRGPISNQP